MDNSALTVGWVAVFGVLATIVAFVLGFCAKTRLYERQIDELIVVVKRPPTFPTAQSALTSPFAAPSSVYTPV